MAAECQVAKREIRQVLCAHTQTTQLNSHPSSPLCIKLGECECFGLFRCINETAGSQWEKAHSHSSPLLLLACTRGGKERVVGTKLKRITVRSAGFEWIESSGCGCVSLDVCFMAAEIFRLCCHINRIWWWCHSNKSRLPTIVVLQNKP